MKIGYVSLEIPQKIKVSSTHMISRGRDCGFDFLFSGGFRL